MNPFALFSFLFLAATLTGCGGCLGALGGARQTSAGPTSTTGAFGGSIRSEVCDPQELANVGATWTYPGVSCPFEPDQQAIGLCLGGGHAALIGTQGYPTLLAAVTAAQPAETVTICPGLHTDVFTARDITLAAADPTPDATVLDAGSDYWIHLADATLRGVTLGTARGVMVENATDAELECLTVHDHAQCCNHVIDGAGGGGGGGTITVRHSLFTRVSGGVIRTGAELVVEDSAFLDNTPNDQTGGAVVRAQGVTLRRTAFIGNEQYVDGNTCVDVARNPHGFTSLIEDCWFEANVSGGTFAQSIVGIGTELAVRGTTFRDNTSDRGLCCLSQGGDGNELRVSDSTFVGNTSSRYRPGGGGVLGGAETVFVERSWFSDNVNVAGSSGASVFSGGYGPWSGADLVVHRNTGGIGALYTDVPGQTTCECCDFGAFADDNDPADAFVGQQVEADLPLNFSL